MKDRWITMHDLKRINEIRELVPDLEILADVIPHWAKAKYKLKIDTLRLEYFERTGKNYREFRE